MKLGFSGNLTRASIRSPLTPLFLLAALAAGLVALLTIPREEEPQISVPMVDIMISANGLRAPEAAELVTKPLETIVKSIAGVEHVYSQTQDDQVMVTARFLVGTPEDTATLRVHEKIQANLDKLPIGIPPPLVVGRGISDVPIVVLTLSPKPDAAGRWTGAALQELAGKLRTELTKVENVGITEVVGAGPDEMRIEPDPEKLSLYGVTLQQLAAKLRDANRSFIAGAVREDGKMMTLTAGQTLRGIPDVGLLVLTTRDGRPVYVRDVARVVVGPGTSEARVWNIASDGKGNWSHVPAASVSLAKRAGANAVVVADAILQRFDSLKGRLIPPDINVQVTRDYGQTANDKANELLFHLGLATVSIVVLIAFAIGWREAVVTLVVIPTTILLTLFAARLMGYTINRVSLFALIFSIGILVDDAIVVVENIARHWAMPGTRSRLRAAVEAVAEVGNPTIVATLTVVAALLPMLFVSGLMGPYMAPIPANASAAMIFSFIVAMVVAPWLTLKLAPRDGRPIVADADAVDWLPASSETIEHELEHHPEGRLGRIYRAVATPLIKTPARAWTFLLLVGAATIAVCVLFYTEAVTVKLLPFDNKSELQVLADLPEGSTVEDTERVLLAAADIARQEPETVSVQAYAGTAAPFNFNGLVRHYYARKSPELGDLQVNLTPKGERDRESHAIAVDLRERLKAVKVPPGTVLKVVEVPPGPPVLATLLAEIYGPDAATRRAVAHEVRKLFEKVPYIVDVDDSIGHPRPRLRIAIDQDELEYFGVEQADVYDTIQALFGGVPVGNSQRGEMRDPLLIRLALPKNDETWAERIASTPVPANTQPGSKTVVELGQVVHVTKEMGSPVIFRRDGAYADMVMAELAGEYEAPIYGMLAVDKLIAEHDWGKLPKPEIRFRGQPADEATPSLLWDGEWEITYVTFRDMGAAFAVAILGIYILVVAQFGSFKLPLVILVPVPLTLIGILPGHWLFHAPFTATSMIGFIALAGIIVRNSILLVDFIRHSSAPGLSLRERVLEAGAIRFKPILLTALAAMIGAATILSDPIFQGLAISLLFGLASSTLLTVLVIPAIYVALRGGDTV
jgi:multidrug efflux pump subunit AcrB